MYTYATNMQAHIETHAHVQAHKLNQPTEIPIHMHADTPTDTLSYIHDTNPYTNGHTYTLA